MICFFFRVATAELALKRKLSFPVSRMWQRWVRRSSKAVVILVSPKTVAHSLKLRLVVMMTLVELQPVYGPAQRELVDRPIWHTDGYVHMPQGPGLGIEVNEDLVTSARLE